MESNQLVNKFLEVKSQLDALPARNFVQTYEALLTFRSGKNHLKVKHPVIFNFKNKLKGAILNDSHPELTTISLKDKELVEKVNQFDYIFVNSKEVSALKIKLGKKSKMKMIVYVELIPEMIRNVQFEHILKGKNCGQIGFGNQNMSQEELIENLEAIQELIQENSWKVQSVSFKLSMSHAF